PGCIGCKTTALSALPAKTIQTITSASKSKALGNKSEKAFPINPSEGCPQNHAGKKCEKDNVSGDRSAAGTSTPTAAAISFREGVCHGLQRTSSHNAYGARQRTK